MKTPLLWLLQTNLYSEEGWDALVSALDRLERPYSIHKVIPFSDGQLDPDPRLPDGARAIVMGSYTMAKYAAVRGWKPGAYLDNLDIIEQYWHWGEHMLNQDMLTCDLRDLGPQFVTGPTFIRPVHDTKAFTGQVFDHDLWSEFWSGVMATPDAVNIGPDTRIVSASKKEIWSETRTWVINRKVITASGYKVGTIKRYSSPEQVDKEITDYAQARAYDWSPNRAYVMDIAQTPNGLKIVEINNLNSAGFYKGDVQKLIMAIEEMES
jgi:hypothetical protein